jgi:hypothetical protein
MVFWPTTHGIKNPLLMGYWTPTHGLLNPCLWYCDLHRTINIQNPLSRVFWSTTYDILNPLPMNFGPPTHRISNRLPMVYRTHYRWYILDPVYIFTLYPWYINPLPMIYPWYIESLPMVFWPPIHCISNPLSMVF